MILEINRSEKIHLAQTFAKIKELKVVHIDLDCVSRKLHHMTT